uniref:SCP domain-containing protein n=1 Tax=Parastrongyloides trichosuri TaxID=131310 RepID=A0A0N5A2Y2_PARTI
MTFDSQQSAINYIKSQNQNTVFKTQETYIKNDIFGNFNNLYYNFFGKKSTTSFTKYNKVTTQIPYRTSNFPKNNIEYNKVTPKRWPTQWSTKRNYPPRNTFKYETIPPNKFQTQKPIRNTFPFGWPSTYVTKKPSGNNWNGNFIGNSNKKTTIPYFPINNIGPNQKIDFKQLKQQFIKETNEYRRKHGVSPLIVDKTIEYKAQKYANYLARTNKFEHERDGKHGENLAVGIGPSIYGVVKLWYDEIKYYNFNRPRWTSQVGHFTQLIWRSSKKFGFGIAKDSNGQIYVVCKYYPRGNDVYKMAENVPRPKY